MYDDMIERVMARGRRGRARWGYSAYAEAVAAGKRALSGADLEGTARLYSDLYAETRKKVAAAWIAEGGHIRRGAHGRLSLEEGPPPSGAKAGHCAAGPTWEGEGGNDENTQASMDQAPEAAG